MDASVSPSRIAYAAAHVVDRPERRGEAVVEQIDWDRTMAFRRYLWSLGLGVAEAMDTAQRNLLEWHAASELIERTLNEARTSAFAWPEVIAGAGVDGLEASAPTLPQLIDEYVRQGEFIQSRGGTVILLANSWMPRRFARGRDYEELYGQVARQLKEPLFLHWLGEMFAPDLAGYFPEDSFWRIMESHAEKVRGVKLSLLDDAMELEMRRRLRPNGQIVMTGDDFHYTHLILGDGSCSGDPQIEIGGRKFPTGDFSHALLGVFDAIAPVAARALRDLAEGNPEEFARRMGATEPLGRHIFEAPTSSYKAGVIFLAYLNGHQDHFSALGDLHLQRSRAHYERIFELARECGALKNPSEANARMAAVAAQLPDSTAVRPL